MQKLFLVLAALVLAGSYTAPATAEECCQHCGCHCACHKVCRVICETKKVPKITYTCECEDFCVPGPSIKCGTHMECDPHDPCAKPKKVIDWQPGCATQRTRHKLIKHETIEEVKSFKWVVDNVCDRCAAQTPAAAPITADATPLPPDAPQPVSRPLTEDDLKQPKWRSYLSFGKK